MPYKGDNINGACKAQGAQLTAKLGYPIANDLDIYTCLGGTVWRADTKTDVPGGAFFRDHGAGVSPVFAGGVEYAITPEIAARLEYQWANSIGGTHTIGTHPGSDMLSLSVPYRFGQDEVALVIAPAPAPAPGVQTKYFTLKSDVLFTFNKTALKPEGQAALDQLYSQLSNLDPEDGPVVILGYTDRINSDAHSQALPERRAQSIVNYLISKGILADKISVHGVGESNPVTGNTCDSVKQCVALIDCLALDRRVEIEAKDIGDVVAQPQA